MAAKKAVKKRVDLFPPGEDERAASVWAMVEARDGKTLVTPVYQYDDLKPGPGWSVGLDGKELEIRSAEGAGFVCGE